MFSPTENLTMYGSVFITVNIFFVTYIIYKRRKKARQPKKPFPLHKLNWEKDVIYLVQFPVSQKVRSISPFSIKLESWIRMNGLKYECVYSSKGGEKRQIPYIEFNGKHIPDSNVAINFLKEYFKERNPKVIFDDISLNADQKAIAHMTKQMLENHTCVVGFYWRYGLNMPEFFAKMIAPAGNCYPSPTARWFFRNVLPLVIRLRAYLQGISRHSPDEVAQFSFLDLEAISRYLGDKKYFFGDDMTTIDCTLYGHLAQFLYIPMAFPQKKFVNENCPNLVNFMARFQEEIWPDWEDACKLECMEGKMGRRLKT